MTVYDKYAIMKFMEAVRPLIKSSKDEETKTLFDEVNSIIEKEFDHPAIDEIERLKKLSRKELLEEWLSYYDGVYVYQCFGHKDFVRLSFLENELLERGMKREMQKLTCGCQEPLSPDELDAFLEKIETLSNEELLKEWEFYQTISEVGDPLHAKEKQKVYFIHGELHGRGIEVGKA